MSDRGHELTEELLKEIESRVKAEYVQAAAEMQKKFRDYMSAFEEQDAIKRALLSDGKITEEEYKNWRFRHMMMGKRWESMRDTLAEDMHNTNLIASRIIKQDMPEVYSLNHDYATYQIEHDAKIDTSYTLYNHDTAERLLREQQELLPKPSAKKAKELKQNPDLVWNQQKLQSAVLQGVLQGESPYDVAKRLRKVADMNYHASVRHARTMTTNVQNAGREEAYDRAKSKGVELTEVWIATLDNRTRHSHRQMHGDKKDEKTKKFSNGLRWPGDPQGDAWEVYNCRCTTNAYVKGFEPELVKYSPKMGDMSFDEWREAKVMTREEQDAWIKAGMPKLSEWRGSVSRKKTVNRQYDEKQLQRYKALLGGKVPKSVDSFQNIKYNSPEEWKELKRQYRSSITGSRQRRIKNEKIAEMAETVKKPTENKDVVSWMKPIAGKHSRLDDIQAVNPNYKTGLWEWENNCQRCVTTYEARRRGFDVTALPCYSSSDRLATGNNFVLPFERGNRKANPLWYEAGLKLSESKAFTIDDCKSTITRLMSDYGNGSRAIISGFWDSNGRGHVFVAENVGGKVQFFDPQSGDMNCASYFDKMGARSLSIFRVDDLPFNSEIVEVFRNDVE